MSEKNDRWRIVVNGFIVLDADWRALSAEVFWGTLRDTIQQAPDHARIQVWLPKNGAEVTVERKPAR